MSGPVGMSPPSTQSDTEGKLRNQVLSQLVTALMNAFPQASSELTTSATGGSHAVPADAVQFLTITINGTPYKIALFNP